MRPLSLQSPPTPPPAPRGQNLEGDGSVRLPDGSVKLPDGRLLRPDGTVAEPEADGSYVLFRES